MDLAAIRYEREKWMTWKNIKPLREAVEDGALALNYACADRFLRTKDGRVRGVLLWNVWEKVDQARELIASPGPLGPDELKGRLTD